MSRHVLCHDMSYVATIAASLVPIYNEPSSSCRTITKQENSENSVPDQNVVLVR